MEINGSIRKTRRQPAYLLRILGAVDDKLIGHLVEFTDNGLLLISSQRLDVYRKYSLKIILPEQINQQNSISLEARCISKREENRSGYFLVGFEFLDISKENLDLITLLLSQYGLMD